jgi:hypothetical protein
MEEDRMSKQIFTQELEGTRQKGRQWMERKSRKRSSNTGSEKMKRVGDR